ncbi:hypothetical protein OHA72_06155 [Dactylosporangium sp. NBC_01737]|uniref:WXG100 family type VII secretion target n=1 Tax=Dactylosporangium sp. NBC_01737 TaxID=2975959 RepID=UPI002E1083A8|nr:hypothetical protein OHA72_06155 [Dactylosporangium sp. NBC_01737]
MIPPARTTADAVADALESVDPAWLHARAARFDEADSHIAGIADGFRSVLREVVEVWQRYEAGGAAPVLGERSRQALRRLEELRSHEPGEALRRAADSLAQARLELRDLRATRAATSGAAAAADERAVAVLNRVSQDFAEAGGHLLALPYGPGSEIAGRGPGSASSTVKPAPMELEAADDPKPLGGRDRLPGLGGVSPLSSLPDTPNPAGGQPMMPMMPMGMGAMGAMGQPGGKDRQPGGQGTADPGAWHEPDDGWETVGRGTGRSDPSGRAAQRQSAEREVERMIDDLREGRRDPMTRRRI